MCGNAEDGQKYKIDIRPAKEEDLIPFWKYMLMPDSENPTYTVIENGEWISENCYGTIHRLASNGRCRGVAKACFAYCREQIPHLRIDTHVDNKIMQRIVGDLGFQYCIYVRDRSPGLAYEYV